LIIRGILEEGPRGALDGQLRIIREKPGKPRRRFKTGCRPLPQCGKITAEVGESREPNPGTR
jgi:hypothetical protein